MNYLTNLLVNKFFLTSTTSEVFKPITNFTDLLLDGLAAVGVVAIIISIVVLVVSFFTHESSQKITAVIGLMAGCLLVAVRIVIPFITG